MAASDTRTTRLLGVTAQLRHNRGRGAGLLLALLLVLTACEGPTGPERPPGQGNTRLTFTGEVGATGAVSVDLPTEAATLWSFPAVSCCISPSGETRRVAGGGRTPGDGGSPWCAVSWRDTHLHVYLSPAPPGGRYAIVVVR